MDCSSVALLRNYINSTDGRYALESERSEGLVPFLPQRCTRLLAAHITPQQSALLFNAGDYIYLMDCNQGVNAGDDPLRAILIAGSAAGTKSGTAGGMAAGAAAGVTAIAFHPAARDSQGDLLVGLGSGEVWLLSLRQQLAASGRSSRPCVVATFAPAPGASAAALFLYLSCTGR